MIEAQIRESLRRRAGLRVDELELMPPGDLQCGAGLGADADPVETLRRLDGAVGLDRNLEASGVQGLDEGPVDLQERLATRQHDEPAVDGTLPDVRDGGGERLGVGVAAALGSIEADKIRVAELACGVGAVFFAPGPEIA